MKKLFSAQKRLVADEQFPYIEMNVGRFVLFHWSNRNIIAALYKFKGLKIKARCSHFLGKLGR